MWNMLRRASDTPANMVSSAMELMQETFRALVYVTAGTGLLILLVTASSAPDSVAMTLWFLSPIMVLTSYLALKTMPTRLLLAEAIWQVGWLVTLTLSVLVFGRAEVGFVFAILPFMAIITVGWPAGIIAELGVVLCVVLLGANPWRPMFSTSYAVAIVLGGAFTTFVGWAASRSLYTVTQWSFHNFAQAQRRTAEARRHRAQLARAVQDLDRAYHRLERTNSALVAAWRSAAEAEEFRANFATNLSHELRTPLNLIIGFCELMLTAPQKYANVPIPGVYRADLNAVFNNAQHLKALVDDVLDLARLDVGKMTISRETVALDELVAEATDMVRDYVEAKELALVVDIEHGLPELELDRLRVRQVLLNLLVNAARFTEAGSITVSATDRDDHIMLRVTDTGRGIKAEDLADIFEEFSGSGSTPSSGWHGTGLGLPISKRFIELHGGRMGVESTYTEGTTFWFTLPRHAPVERRAGQLVRTEPVRRMAQSKRVVVLAHEDSKVASMLQRHMDGYRFVSAATPQEGIALANRLRALALIVDTPDMADMLPDAIENNDLVVMSCPLPRTTQTARALGAEDLLVKPVSHDELMMAIADLGRPIRRVLLADDDPDMIRLFRRMLTPEIQPRDCLEAHNGQEALDLMRTEHPDLVLLDLMMPGQSGYDVLAARQSEPDLADMAVIIVSAREKRDIGVRLWHPIQVQKAGGLQLGDVIRALEANLNALAPGWA